VFDLYLRWLVADGWKLLAVAALIDLTLAGIAYLAGRGEQ